MNKRFDVIGIENLILDFAVQTDRIPSTDDVSTLLDCSWQPGGNVANAIVTLARLGARTGMVGTIGTDAEGQFCKSDLARHGIDTSHIYAQPGQTSMSVAIAETSSSGRSFIARFGTYCPLGAEEMEESFIAGATCIHICVPITKNTLRAVELARKNGVLVSVDAGSYDEQAGSYVLKNCDILIMSEFFYHSLFSDDNYVQNMQTLVHRGCKAAVVTLGAKGCAGADDRGQSFALPAFSGHSIADTTGAGDVFHGGFLYGYLQGWDLNRCARFASAVSYLNCMTLGGRAGIPDKTYVEDFLHSGTIDPQRVAPGVQYYKEAMCFNRMEEQHDFDSC